MWTPSLPIVAVAEKVLVICSVGVMGIRARWIVRGAEVVVVKDLVIKRELVSNAVRLSAVDARDIQRCGERGGDDFM